MAEAKVVATNPIRHGRCYGGRTSCLALRQIVVYAEDRSPRLLSALYDLLIASGASAGDVAVRARACLWSAVALSARSRPCAARCSRRSSRAPARQSARPGERGAHRSRERTSTRCWSASTIAQQNEGSSPTCARFKNPVAAIRVSADSLANANLSPERVVRTAHVLRESSSRLDGLVRSVRARPRGSGNDHETWTPSIWRSSCRT